MIKQIQLQKAAKLSTIFTLLFTSSICLAAPASIPGKIEAENADRYYDTTPNNSGSAACGSGDLDVQITSDIGGGCNIGWTARGEWTEYDISAAKGGTYNVSVRIASNYTGKKMHLYLDGADISGFITAPRLGWQKFSDVVFETHISAGNHTLKAVFDTGAVNLNYVTISLLEADVLDEDGDAIADDQDICPNTPQTEAASVDGAGCAPSQRDSDNDAIPDNLDTCPATPAFDTATVNELGCGFTERDDDEDGTPNPVDLCPNTLAGAQADPNGCTVDQLDSDNDGINNLLDRCPQYGMHPVTEYGCALNGDEDQDSVVNRLDNCPFTFGLLQIGGCKPSFDDFDSDGVPDDQDQCPVSKSAALNMDGPSFGCADNDFADDDADGTPNGYDHCPNSDSFGQGNNSAMPGCSYTQMNDDDGDGVINGLDACPMEFGPQKRNGCLFDVTDTHSPANPIDFDGDNVPNPLDHCPFTPQLPPNANIGPNGCAFVFGDTPETLDPMDPEDQDQDGVINSQDRCPNSAPGHVVDTQGCTGAQQKYQQDSDLDGVNDVLDQCPDEPGQHSLLGCNIDMDPDHDGVFEPMDQCPYEPGHRLNHGCRNPGTPDFDRDGDSVPIELDDCPYSNINPTGAFTTQSKPDPMTGCSSNDFADYDLDGVINGKDLCPLSINQADIDDLGCGDWDRLDSDRDGVMNGVDLCPTLFGIPTLNGCSKSGSGGGLQDGDQDGVENDFDQCPYTPFGGANPKGCAESFMEDNDGDGITNDLDQCPKSPKHLPVTPNGCEFHNTLDNDQDGVIDLLDKCWGTPPGQSVDAKGCENNDIDHDQVPNELDLCPLTPFAAKLSPDGCSLQATSGRIANYTLPENQTNRPYGFFSLNSEEILLANNLNNPFRPIEFIVDPRFTLSAPYIPPIRVTTLGNRIEGDYNLPSPQSRVVIPVRFHYLDTETYSNWFEIIIGKDHSANTIADLQSVIINDRHILDMTGISLRQVFDLLTFSPGLNTNNNGLMLFRQFWDSQRTQSSLGLPFFCNGNINTFPVVCDRPETNVANLDDFMTQMEMDSYQLNAVVNRMDLRNDWQDCGEHRLVFSKKPGSGARLFINFEARVPNPTPGDISGCKEIIQFWSDLPNQPTPEKAQRIFELFYGGPFNAPIIIAENFKSTTGQLRTLQNEGPGWLFKEHKLDTLCDQGFCNNWIKTVSVKENPFGQLFDAQVVHQVNRPWHTVAQDFQQWLPNNMAGLVTPNLAELKNPVPDHFNHGQSLLGEPENDYLMQFNNSAGSFFSSEMQIALTAERNADQSPLKVDQVIARATALSCGGCHAPMDFGLDQPGRIGNVQLPDGTIIDRWPNSHGFIHINENGDLSPALQEVFLPMRQALFGAVQNQLNNNALNR